LASQLRRFAIGPLCREVSARERLRWPLTNLIGKRLLTRELKMTHQQYQSCIEACVACAQECEHCANACLQEKDVAKIAECIRLDRDCAEICWGAAAWTSPEKLDNESVLRTG
jgi:hypothetical protein